MPPRDYPLLCPCNHDWVKGWQQTCRGILFKYLLLVGCFLLGTLNLAHAAREQFSATRDLPNTERVLVLWSFPRVYPWVLEVDSYFNKYAIEQLNQTQSSQSVIVEEEFLPFQGGTTTQWSPLFLDYMAEKYKGQVFDRVIAIDLPATVFISENPKIFNYKQVFQIVQKHIQDISRSHQVSAVIDSGKVAWEKISKTFTPKATHTLLIANHSSALNSVSQEILRGTDWLKDGNYTHLDPLNQSVGEIRDAIARAGPTTRVIYFPVTTSRESPNVIPRQYLKEISAGINQPIYCSVSSFLGAGCLAGFGESSRLFAKQAAVAVYGEPKGHGTESLYEVMLDEARLKELGFTRPAWYQEALVNNPQLTLWERHKITILVSSSLTLLFAFAISVLLNQRHTVEQLRVKAQSDARRLQNILTGTNIGTWEWNIQTGETRFNERWAEIVGYELQALEPTSIDTWMKLAHPDDLAGSELKLKDHFRGKLPFYELETRMRHKDGHWVWVLDRGQVATWTDNGDPEWMYGTHQEISERKQLEEQLQRRTDEAENALKVKSEFLAAMSHEIRTPLHGVLGLAELAKKESDPMKSKNYIEGIQRSGRLLMNILNDILDFSRLEAGRAKLKLEGFDLRTLLEESCELFAASASLKGISVSLNISSRTPKRLFADPIRLAQMVNNYLGNAIKFTSTGSVTLSVDAERCNARYRLKVRCQDTGPGVSQEDQTQLFQPFSQVSQASRKRVGGTGLGLVLVQEFARLMGGECGVESKDGVGSTFWFEVMVEPSEDSTDGTVAKSTPDFNELKGKHVLIVEDTYLNVLIVEANLDQYLITHACAANGLEAIKQIESSLRHGGKPFDAVLMDVQMPVMDGIEATRFIKTNFPHASPIIGLSAGVLPNQISECINAGMDAFLSKPLDTNELFCKLVEITRASPRVV